MGVVLNFKKYSCTNQRSENQEKTGGALKKSELSEGGTVFKFALEWPQSKGVKAFLNCSGGPCEWAWVSKGEGKAVESSQGKTFVPEAGNGSGNTMREWAEKKKVTWGVAKGRNKRESKKKYYREKR